MATEPRRTGRWIPVVYYYLATVIGLVILLVGVIQGLRGLAKAAFPELSDEVRYAEPEHGFEGREMMAPEDRIAPERKKEISKAELVKLKAARKEEAIRRARLGGFSEAVEGLIAAMVGAPVFFWHLRQARRKEPEWFGTIGPEGSA